MKKLLIASTALVMVAGAAAAEVKLSGDARMGVMYNGDDWNFSSRSRVLFTMSGTTDSGLEFGASFKAHESVGAETGEDGTVFLSGAFGKIEMGDALGASEALFGDLYEVGYTDLDDRGGNDIPYLTGDETLTAEDNPVLLDTYSAGAFSVAASMSDGKVGETSTDDAQEMAVAAAYTFGNYTVGLGYEKIDSPDTALMADMEQLELAAIAKFGATNVKAYYADGELDRNAARAVFDLTPVLAAATAVDHKAYGLSVDSTFGATTVGGYVQVLDIDTIDDVTYYGLGASYDLGGGASIVGGIADNDLPNSDMVADLGVKFKF
ncbi:porin [Rhodobacter capsulatus]|uniref:porin n=1 Tax=Rhodobacter capsulatus TaxID=1061 RepID=UPI00402690C2